MKRKPSTFEGIMCLSRIILVTGLLWQYLEILIYGDVQPRLVDDIMAIVWILFIVGAYAYGKYIGTAEKRTLTISQQSDVKLHVFKNKNDVWFIMKSELNGQRIALTAIYSEDVARRIAVYLAQKEEKSG